MKIGVKTFDSENFLKYFEDKADFFEIMTAQKNDYSFLKNFSLPIVIHAEHHNFGINPADITKKEISLKSLNFARKIADMTNAKKIVVHGGTLDEGSQNCSLENAINFFREINDERILIENLPRYHDGNKNLCSDLYRIKKFLNETDKKFCFDINHYLQNFKHFDRDYSFIRDYLKLNPEHYHIGGQGFSSEKAIKGHLCFADSEIDLKKILSYYPDDAEITLETTITIEEVENDVKIIRNVLRNLSE